MTRASRAGSPNSSAAGSTGSSLDEWRDAGNREVDPNASAPRLRESHVLRGSTPGYRVMTPFTVERLFPLQRGFRGERERGQGPQLKIVILLSGNTRMIESMETEAFISVNVVFNGLS